MKKLLLLLFLCFCTPAIAQGISLNDVELQPVKYEVIAEFNKPEGFIGIQGMAVTDKYFIVAVVNSDDTSTSLVIIDKKTQKLADLKENPIIGNFGHANDMEYDPTTDELYIIDNNKIHVFNASTLKLIKDIYLPDNLNVQSIAKDNQGNWYFRDKSNSYTYDSNLKLISKYSVSELTGRQGIAYQNGKIFYSCYPKLTIENETVNNLIYVYNNEKLENILMAPNEYGEIEAMEFYNGTPYVLYSGSDKIGRIVVPVYESITVNITVADKTKDNSEALLSLDKKVIEQVKKENEKYTFSPITYKEPGKYQYIIEKQSNQKNDNNKNLQPIKVDVDVTYDASKNQLLASVNYTEEEFKEIKVEDPKKDSNNVEPPKSNETPKDTTTNESEIENPKTGFPVIYTIFIMFGLVAGFNIYHKKKLYKL